MDVIESVTNPRLKRVRRLWTGRGRTSTGLFVAEGEDLLRVALDAGVTPVEVLAAAGVPVRAGLEEVTVRVTDAAMASISQLGHPARVVSVFAAAALPSPPGDVDFALVLHGVADPGNVGTLVRGMLAMGGRGVVALGRGCADPTGTRAVRASMGAIFAVPVVDLDDIGELPVVALDADGETALADVDLTGRVAIHVGAERAGLPEALRRPGTRQARIPQMGQVGSLNVAMAGSIALYERACQLARPI